MSGAIKTSQFEFDAEGGENRCIELPAAARGKLERLVIKQISGAVAGFTYDVLDRRDACESEAAISSSFDTITLLDKELHRIMPQQVVVGAADSHFDMAYTYQNQDEQPATLTPKTRIYLDIAPGGSGTKTFQVAYTVESISSI